jgi:hypothetical protein
LFEWASQSINSDGNLSGVGDRFMPTMFSDMFGDSLKVTEESDELFELLIDLVLRKLQSVKDH